jgi:hypothetical protein
MSLSHGVHGLTASGDAYAQRTLREPSDAEREIRTGTAEARERLSRPSDTESRYSRPTF